MSKIDDISLCMTFELYFDLTWTESRLIINESSPEWDAGEGTVMGSINFIKSMWLPDIQIQNLKNFQLRSIVTDVAGLIIFKNKKVLYTVATEAIISCPMKFSAYPLDHQVTKHLVFNALFTFNLSWVFLVFSIQTALKALISFLRTKIEVKVKNLVN